MNTPNYGYGWQTGAGRIDRTLFDEGLRQHMLRVYNYMGDRSRIHRPRRLHRWHDARALRANFLDAAEMGGDACAARLRAFVLVPDADDLGSRRSRDVLGLLRRDGPVNGLHLPGFHRNQHRAHLLHRGRDVRRYQPLRLHDQARSTAVLALS